MFFILAIAAGVLTTQATGSPCAGCAVFCGIAAVIFVVMAATDKLTDAIRDQRLQ